MRHRTESAAVAARSSAVATVDEGDRERQDPPTRDDEVVHSGEGDPEWQDAPTSGDEEVDDQHNWRRWAWWALIIATVGVGWALVLATILVVRSGDRTAELISLFEEGQQQRQAALGNVPQSQEERQAALRAQQQQSQTFRAQELAALAAQGKSNAEARQALADAALAGSRANKADSEAQQADAQAALAQARAEAEARRANRQAAAQPAARSNRQLQADALATLAAAIEGLREAIKQIDNRGPGR